MTVKTITAALALLLVATLGGAWWRLSTGVASPPEGVLEPSAARAEQPSNREPPSPEAEAPSRKTPGRPSPSPPPTPAEPPPDAAPAQVTTYLDALFSAAAESGRVEGEQVERGLRALDTLRGKLEEPERFQMAVEFSERMRRLAEDLGGSPPHPPRGAAQIAPAGDPIVEP